jgi:hypothetical protein
MAKPLIDLNYRLNDLVARSVALREPTNTACAKGEGLPAQDTAADVAFTYGAVDMRGQQPNEQIVTVPQGTGSVRIFYNASTREARPIPKQVK